MGKPISSPLKKGKSDNSTKAILQKQNDIK